MENYVKKVGNYRLIRKISEGGMGEIWEAHDDHLNIRVAIKLMRGLSETDEVLKQRFSREAQAIARLDTPHVVKVLYSGLHDRSPYIVMELLGGEDLARRLRHSKRMSLDALLPIISQVAKALDCAHANDIIHRDIKPANIFLHGSSPDEVVKVLDFGIASTRQQFFTQYGDPRRAGETPEKLTQADEVVGTPHYMSPEQFRSNETLDHRADIWSLAVVTFEAFTGELPFEARSYEEMQHRVCTADIPPPSSLVKGLSESLGASLDRFFERALRKNPSERFQSAQEFVLALSKLCTPADHKPTTILVVDDEEDVEVLIRQTFRPETRDGSYALEFAGDGQQALDILRARSDIDVVLTDLHMPRMDGLTFLQEANQLPHLLRTIVISAFDDMKNIRAAMNAGAYDFVVKPWSRRELRQVVEKAAHDVRERRRSLRSLEENATLRLFVDREVIETLLPLRRVSSSFPTESFPGTALVIELAGISRSDGSPRGSSEDSLADSPETAMDSDQTIARINRAIDAIVSQVEDHGGAVARFLGDRVLVCFRGDEHERDALQASVQLRELDGIHDSLGHDSLGHDSLGHAGVCIGVGSGLIVTGSVGAASRLRFERGYLGEAITTARTLASLAAPGQILVTDETRQRIGRDFEWQPIAGATTITTATAENGADARDEPGPLFNISSTSPIGNGGDSPHSPTEPSPISTGTYDNKPFDLGTTH